MNCTEFDFQIPFTDQFQVIESYIRNQGLVRNQQQILRFIATSLNKDKLNANILISDKADEINHSIFSFNKRSFHTQKDFNVCFLIPTGIGCEIGGHAGDGTTALKLIASSCDKVITHPNVVNASDINEMVNNALYVEGSHITQLLMGNIGLNEIRNNRVLVIIANNDQINHNKFVNSAINSVNGARSTLGLEADIVLLDNPMTMKGAISNNKAIGEVLDLENLYKVLKEKKGSYDAVAITSKISIPENLHEQYSTSDGDMPNPWGSTEAMLTHFISTEFGVPSAHAPMFENNNIAEMDFGVVDARIAPEVVSTTFFHCVLKGLQKAPAIVCDKSLLNQPNIFSAKDISALIIPDEVFGLPVLAALHQGIKVIAVKNKNYMKNDLTKLPWQKGQFQKCENYLEASGILNCIKEGISIESVKRPLKTLHLTQKKENVLNVSV